MGGRDCEGSDEDSVATTLVLLPVGRPAWARLPWSGRAMRVGRLRRRCERRLAQMALPTPLDIDALFDDLAAERGRAIEVVLVDTPIAGPCALWLALPDRDYVVVERGTDPLHRDQMKLHEWAHMVCGHRGILTNDAEWAGRVLPDLDPAMIKMVMGRRAYSEEEEAEAEMMASLMLALTPGRPGGTPGHRQPFEDERGAGLDALTNALEGRGRDR